METKLFTFSEKEEYSYEVETNLTLHIKRDQPGLSFLYFKLNGDHIDMPSSITIFEHILQSTVFYDNVPTYRKFLVEPEFLKCWKEFAPMPSTRGEGKNYCKMYSEKKYSICYNNKVILNINPQPHVYWEITTN